MWSQNSVSLPYRKEYFSKDQCFEIQNLLNPKVRGLCGTRHNNLMEHFNSKQEHTFLNVNESRDGYNRPGKRATTRDGDVSFLGTQTLRKGNTLLMQLVPLFVDRKFRSFITTPLSKHTYAY
jgi:hypothetical protein